MPGDLLFYASGDYINHVAIYIGGGQVIHASNPTTGICITPANYRTPCKAVTFLD
jgi:cell wall-associated NlpC family hydrolase